MADIQKIQCVSCGGSLAAEQGQSRVPCQYCGSVSLLIRNDRLAYYSLTPELSHDQALNQAETLIVRTGGRAMDLPLKKEISHPELYFIPCYEIQGIRIGKFEDRTLDRSKLKPANIRSLYGPEDGRRTAVSAPRPRRGDTDAYKTDTRIIMGDMSSSQVAVHIENWGLESLSVSRLRTRQEKFDLVPLNMRNLQKMGTVIHPGMTFESFYSSATRFAPSGKHAEFHLMDREESLVYYPVFRITYRYRRTPYDIIIDAVTGKTLYARFPQDIGRRILAFLSCVGMLGLSLGWLVNLFFSSSRLAATMTVIQTFGFLPLIFLAFMMILILAAISLAWTSLRYPTEIVFENDSHRVERIGKPAETLPEKILKQVLDRLENIKMEKD